MTRRPAVPVHARGRNRPAQISPPDRPVPNTRGGPKSSAYGDLSGHSDRQDGMPRRNPRIIRPDVSQEHSVQSMPTGKALYRVIEAMEILSLGRSVMYEQIRSGRLRSVKEGRTRLIPAWAIDEYVALLAAEAGYAGLEVAS